MKLSWPLEPSYVENASFCSSGGEKWLMGQTTYCAQGSGRIPGTTSTRRSRPSSFAGEWLHIGLAVLYAELSQFFQCWSWHCGLAPTPPLSHVCSQIVMREKFSYRFLSFVCPEVFVLGVGGVWFCLYPFILEFVCCCLFFFVTTTK